METSKPLKTNPPSRGGGPCFYAGICIIEWFRRIFKITAVPNKYFHKSVIGDCRCGTAERNKVAATFAVWAQFAHANRSRSARNLCRLVYGGALNFCANMPAILCMEIHGNRSRCFSDWAFFFYCNSNSHAAGSNFIGEIFPPVISQSIWISNHYFGFIFAIIVWCVSCGRIYYLLTKEKLCRTS